MRNGMSYSEAGKLGAKFGKDFVEKKYKENLYKYDKSPKRCAECGTKIEYEKRINKFCSHKCSAINSNKKRASPKRFCLNCGKQLSTKGLKQKCCSQKCHIENRKKTMIDSWIKTGIPGKFTGGKSGGTPRVGYIIDTIMDEQNGKCCICGGDNKWIGKVLVFIIDHIDGDVTNNKRENLRLICPNCNSQTETFGGRNKGNGRRSKGFIIK